MEPTSKPTVLVGNDAPFNIDVIRHVLQGRYRVKAAPSGGRALEVAGKPPATDASVLDVMLPDMDGFAVCRSLRDHPPTRGIPIIFVSGLRAGTEAARALAQAGVGYIGKPVDPDLLRVPLVDAIASTQPPDGAWDGD